MLTVTPDQYETLADDYKNDFLLEVVCDWYALYEIIYDKAARTPFDDAWEVAEYLLERLESVPQEWEREVSYELIHRVLLAKEQGWSLELLPEAMDYFCLALPAYDAAFALLSMAFMGSGDSPAVSSVVSGF
ncbi:MAG: hypothetical protein J2P41_04725 [Blastocatellia bacterium]|nr:hypothetical protein [Blastocatellia bacterium]